ncbi:MAG: LTA synthase family protein [Synergistaceae bacterium]|nr:LTA synthase family protein [Synergistaceae bacterium]
MKSLSISRGVYRTAGRDCRELIFFTLLALSLFLKFYFLEYELSEHVRRAPLSVASSAALAAFAAAAASLFWRRGRLAAALLLDLGLTALLVADLLYMRYYSDLFSFHNLGLSSQLGEISDSVFALFSPHDLLYFIDMPLLFGYYRIFGRISVRPFFRRLTLRRLAGTLLFSALLLSVFAFHIYSYNRLVPGVLRSMWDRPAICCNIGALSYHAADGWNTLRDKLSLRALGDAEADELRLWYENTVRNRPRPAGLFGAEHGKNLIVIQAESLQSFVVGLKVGGREVMPNINAFAREASLSAEAYSQTASGNSSDAEFLVNAALYPAASGVAYTRFAGNRYRALPHALKEAGYITLAMHGDRPGFWNRAHMYPALGFDRFISKKDYVNDEIIGLGLSDRSFFRQSLAMLEAEKKPFYAFMITLTSHYPFSFAELIRQADFDPGAETEGAVLRSYLAAIHYFDREFGAFIDGLKRSGLYGRSVIVLYGDHAAVPRWDSEALSKLLGTDLSKDHNWRRVNSVPLIINAPGVKKLPRDEKMALGLVNLPSSLAALLGVDFSDGLGESIFSGRADAPVIFRNGSYVTGDIFVEPANGRAVNIKSGEAADYADFSALTEESAKILHVSDMILEYDLLRRFDGGAR